MLNSVPAPQKGGSDASRVFDNWIINDRASKHLSCDVNRERRVAILS
jgi:hypothetical protein